jgi:autotransporter-associated beta strand protein
VTNNAAASITGGLNGIFADTGFANVTNSGSITGTSGDGIFAFTNATVTNNSSATIAGDSGIYAVIGFADVTNSGRITGTSGNGIFASTNATVTNDAGASIAGGFSGISARFGFAHVVNSGSIEGTIDAGIVASTNATVTNIAGARIAGGLYGIRAFAGSSSVFNAGTITGFADTGIAASINATVTNDAGASIAGGLYGIRAFAGGSSVFNAGTISGGTAAIQFGGAGNTLTLAQGSVISGNVLGTGSDTFQLGGAGAATFDISTLGPAAQYQGFGTFNKIGSSVWTLTGASTFTGDVNVNAGTLVVNGNLSSAGIMMVNPGGTLAGTGTVPLTLVDNAATLAPGPLGSGTGSLTINDRVMFCTCSTYAVKVSGTGNDFAQIMAGALGTGDAFLDGAAVRVSSPTSTYRFNSPYTILTTQGGLNGTTFDSLALATPSGIVGTLSYTANDVLLTLTSQLAQTAGLNQNQRAVAAALDAAFNAPGSQTGALGAIFTGNVAQNLTQASGETATGSQQATFNAMTQFMGVMTDPFMAGRGDPVSSSGGAPQFAEESDRASSYADNGKPRTRSERDAYAAIYRKVRPMVDPFAQRWSVWAAGFGGSQTTDGHAGVGSNTATSRIYGTAVGADYRFSPFTLAGFALAGGGTSFTVNGFGSGRSDLFQAGAFLQHTVGPAYISAALAYGWQDITTDRTITIGGVDQLRAKFNANAFSGRVEGGYRFVTPGMGITPYAAGQFTTFDLPGYTEQALSGSNTFALNYGAKSVTASRSELGVRTDKSWAIADAIFTLRGRLAWAHDLNTDRNIAATFQTLPGASFVVNGAAPAHDAALTTASAEMKFIGGLSLAATFEGEFSDVTGSYAGKGVVRYAW